jgi:hypothetical protein
VFVQTIKYLLSIPKIKREANAVNMIGFTPLDVLEACNACLRDLKCFEIQNILKEAGVKRSTNLNSFIPLAPSGIGVDGAQRAQLRFWRWWESVRLSLSKHWKQQGNWIEETRGTLMIVATVIATMTFQAGISPPGGVWQQNTSNSTEGFYCTQGNICEAGKAVLSYSNSDAYLRFLYFNSTSFSGSLCVILLVIIGFPLRSRSFIWLLMLAMNISITSMMLTYSSAVVLVTPVHILEKVNGSWNITLSCIYIGVIGIVCMIHIIRLLSWIVKKLIHKIRLLYWTMKKLCAFICNSTRDPAEDPANV